MSDFSQLIQRAESLLVRLEALSQARPASLIGPPSHGAGSTIKDMVIWK